MQNEWLSFDFSSSLSKEAFYPKHLLSKYPYMFRSIEYFQMFSMFLAYTVNTEMKLFVNYSNCQCSAINSYFSIFVPLPWLCMVVVCCNSALSLLVLVLNPACSTAPCLQHSCSFSVDKVDECETNNIVRQRKTMFHKDKLFILIPRLSGLRKQEIFQIKCHNKKEMSLHFYFRVTSNYGKINVR